LPPVGSGWRTGLDLTGVGGDGNIGDRCILGLTGAVEIIAVNQARFAISIEASVSVSVPI